MAEARDVAAFVGSLRKESFNRKLARALIDLAPPPLHLDIVEIGHLGPYNQDTDANPPADWVALRNRIKQADAVLFVTPEYNRGVPGVLKNAIDIASRPYGQNAWDGKPGGVVSGSTGAVGGFGANHQLRQAMVFLNMPVLQQPEAYIGGIDKRFDASGKLIDESTRGFLSKYLAAFADWITRNAPADRREEWSRREDAAAREVTRH
jgi:chromate reductase